MTWNLAFALFYVLLSGAHGTAALVDRAERKRWRARFYWSVFLLLFAIAWVVVT